MIRASERTVIVGGGVAGLRTAEALRSRGFSGDLLGVSAEARYPYARPPLSKEALRNPDGVGAPLPTTADVRWQLGVTATGLDVTGGYVELDDDRRVAFDAVVLATGVRARRLPGPIRGMALRTAEDAEWLRSVLHGTPGRVVIVGAGFVGSEVAVAARSRQWHVTVVDVSPSPLATALGPHVARWLWEQHRAHGIELRLGDPVVAIEKAEARLHVLLGTGDKLIADAVVTGLGARPNTEWLDGSGLDITDGVLTDAAQRAVTTGGTALPNVVAVGDLARTPTRWADGEAVRWEHWAGATTDAHRAAAALMGQNLPADVPPVFWTDVYEHRVQVIGLPKGVESEPEAGPRGFCVGYRAGGVLTGAVAVNWPQRLPMLRRELCQRAAA